MRKLIKLMSIVTIFGITFWGCQDFQSPTESDVNNQSSALVKKNVEEAKLFLDVTHIDGIKTLQIYKVSEVWSEALATWIRRTDEDWSNMGGTYHPNPVVEHTVSEPFNGVLEIDITDLWKDGIPPKGILIKDKNPSGENNYIQFASREHTTRMAPKVEVLYDKGSRKTINVVSDSYLWYKKLAPKGTVPYLFAGNVYEREKRTVLNFLEDKESKSCETAFGYNKNLAQCFIDDLDYDFSRWGWTNGVLNSGDNITLDVYAGAGQCDLSKGTKVGTVEVKYDGENVIVAYNMMSGYTMSEIHFYVGNTKYPMVERGRNGSVPTVAPGKYTYKKDLDGASSHSFSLEATGDIYIIAHAVVCGNF